jgi:hypothetical protein
MQYTVTAQQLDDIPEPAAYSVYRGEQWRLLSDLLLELCAKPWPLDADARTQSAVLERRMLAWADARIRESAPAVWPSSRVGGIVPRVLPLYRTALSDAECAVDAALRAHVSARCRVYVVRRLFELPQQGVAALLAISPAAPVIAGLPNTRRAIERELRPPPADLQQYGDTADTVFALSKAGADAVAAAMLLDLRAVFGDALRGAPDKLALAGDVAAHLVARMQDTGADYARALDAALRVLKTAAAATQYELDSVLPPYVAQLEAIWADVARAFATLLDSAQTLDELEIVFTDDVARRAEATLTVLESYRHAAPVVAGGGDGCGAPISGMPTTRDTSMLLDTPIGLHVLRLSQVLRTVMPEHGGALRKFFADLPRGLPAVPAGAGFVLGTRRLRREPLDLVADYFCREINPVTFVPSDAINVDMYSRYAQLRRQRDIDADAAARAST